MTCSRKIGPFDCCSVVQGDCLELMPLIPGHYCDLVLTDPPYGIGMAANPFRQAYEPQEWDSAIPSADAFKAIFRSSREQIIWGGNYFDLPPSQGFLVWDKVQPEDFSSAMCEQAWTSIQSPAKLFRFRVVSYAKEHPTQKPVELMEWCIRRAKEDADVILDPFLGSGTTAVAAKKLGRHFLGFEISAEYCQIARDRLARIDAQPKLFEPRPEQMALV